MVQELSGGQAVPSLLDGQNGFELTRGRVVIRLLHAMTPRELPVLEKPLAAILGGRARFALEHAPCRLECVPVGCQKNVQKAALVVRGCGHATGECGDHGEFLIQSLIGVAVHVVGTFGAFGV